jgi:hypothetical protein
MFELLIKGEAQWPIRDAHQRDPNYDQAGISADPIFHNGGEPWEGRVLWRTGLTGSLACTVRRLCAEMSLVNGQVSENLANPRLRLLAGQASSSSQSTPIQRKGPSPPISLTDK